MNFINPNHTINLVLFLIFVISTYLIILYLQEKKEGIKIRGKIFRFIPHYLPIKELTRNCYVWGSTWAWKTVIINHILDEALEMGVKCFILDIKGDYERAIGKRGLVISHEHQLIDFFHDLAKPEKTLYIDEIADFIFPQASSGDFFDTAGSQLFKHVITEAKVNSFDDFVKAINKENYLADTYKKHTGIDELWNSARDVISTFKMRTDKYIKLLSQSKLTSLQRLLETDKQITIIRSIPNLYSVYAVFNTIYFMLLMNEILTFPDSKEQKFLFLLDEAGTLKTLSFVDNFVSLCRSKWAGCLVASQSLSQLGQYKDNILNNCNYKLIGRLNDLEDIQYFEQLFLKLWKEGKKYKNVWTLPDLHFYQIRHLEADKIDKTKVNYFKL